MKKLVLALLCPLFAQVYATESVYSGFPDEAKQAIERIDCTFTIYRDEGAASATWDDLVALLEQAAGSFHASDEEVEVLLERFHELMQKMYAMSKDEPSIHGGLTLSGAN